MKIYSYRPPRIRPIDFDLSPRKKSSFRIFSLLAVLLLFFAFAYMYSSRTPPPSDLVSAVVSDGINVISPSPSILSREALLLEQMKPFLKSHTPPWQFRGGAITQAIGGGDALLDQALHLSAALSVNFSTGDVYYSHNAHTRLRLASITKIMTAITASDLVHLDESFSVSVDATRVEPTVIGVRVGESLTARELITAGLLTSGNDVMAVLAEGVGKKYHGDTSLFVAAMNEKAARIGLKNTRFANPQGYDDPDHYSTASDIAIMTHYALTHYPEIARIVSLKESTLPATSTHAAFKLPNWNMLIGTYPGADGVKTGITDEAKHTTVATATRDGHRILVVVLGADSIIKRDLSAAELLNAGFSHLGIAPFHITEDLLRTRIKDWY